MVRCEPRFAFGAAGRPAVREGDAALPPDAPVEFHVRLMDLGAAMGEPGAAEQLEEGQRKRILGNMHFQYSDFEKVDVYASTCLAKESKSQLFPCRAGVSMLRCGLEGDRRNT